MPFALHFEQNTNVTFVLSVRSNYSWRGHVVQCAAFNYGGIQLSAWERPLVCRTLDPAGVPTRLLFAIC